MNTGEFSEFEPSENSHVVLFEEGATEAQRSEAHAILGALDVAYPGHPWAVRVYDGGFFIRHLDFPANYGMNAKFKDNGYSASALKRDVILKAGEWLERANLARGRANGDEIGRVEGVPEKYQPHQALDLSECEVVVAKAPERTEPMPQVKDAV